MDFNKVKPLIFGTGLSSSKDYQGLLNCSTAAVDSGIRWFDTAPSYKTEELLGRVIGDILKNQRLKREDVLVQTKIDPIQMYEGKVRKHVESTLKKMSLDYFDCLLIHWPVYNYFRKTWDVLERLKDDGIVRRIGICNLRITHLNELQGIGIMPDILQIERHPLNSFEEERLFCIKNNIVLQDYSPLCKMHPLLSKDSDLIGMANNHSCGIGEVILLWHIQTGAIPIFTSTKTIRIQTYANLGSIKLSEDEVAAINTKNINYKLYLESLICPGF